jgi:hypothetical protein
MFDDATRAKLASALNDSFKHRAVDGAVCAVCGQPSDRLAMHVLKYAQSQSAPLPAGFVPMSASGGTIRGAFPVCDQCAPACPKCGLPELTKNVRAAHQRLTQQLHSSDSPLMYGNGICKHAKLLGFRI